jgi:serine protease inhibitor
MPTVSKNNAETLGQLTSAERQIERAKHLESQRAEIMVQVAKNRDYLRLMDQNGELTEEQGVWLDAFYPLKERGARRSKDDIDATRRAKAEARGKS